MSLIRRATLFADERHAGAKRKFSGEPYIVHPLAVADLVEQTGASEAVIAAAVMHDVLEDTDTSEQEMRAAFGDEVTGLVVEVTNVYRSRTGRPRAERKANERARLALVSPDAQTIKVADIIDNCSSVAERNAEFAALFLPEARALVEVLGKAAPVLLARAKKILAMP